ncbi:hypothetical protein DM02DRAFT_484893, partial [Periconia macrospinosa]
CPEVKCDASDAAKLCKCRNSRERLCKIVCPAYTPTYLPCPISPPTTTCEERFCIMMWPQSCYCANANKQACYEKCGASNPISKRTTTTASTQTTRKPLPRTPTSTINPTPTPYPTHAPCGGGRPNYLSCDEGFICIKDPYKPGCGPECDGLGICVEDKICGGFAGFACGAKEQVCWDDPRDECKEGEGGNDCAGVCVWP